VVRNGNPLLARESSSITGWYPDYVNISEVNQK
jgi:hypothetical protein